MEIKKLKSDAKNALSTASSDPQRLMLTYIGAVALLTLLLSVVDLLLQQKIDNTIGLGGIGTRSMLSTIVAMLRLLPSILLPFWNMGYLHASLCLSRGECAEPGDLFSGFRCLGPVVRLHLLQGLVYLILILIVSYLFTAFLMFTGIGLSLMQQLQSIGTDLDPEQLASILYGSGPVLTLGLLGFFLLIFLPVAYHLRLSAYFLMDAPEKGAIYALISSFQSMRGNCLSMVRLDLSFLWFYVLEVLIGLLCYGDAIAQALHIPLPLSPDEAYLLFLGAYLLCQFGLYMWQKNYVSVTYACAYRTLAEQPEEP